MGAETDRVLGGRMGKERGVRVGHEGEGERGVL